MTDTERITNEVCNRFLTPDNGPLYAPDGDPLAPARGICNGIVLGIIFWACLLLCFCPWSCK